MALPALVLVHGYAHAADCWDLTLDEIHRLAPELDVLAVDLPEQLASIAAIGGVQVLISLDTCHGLMVSEPKLLAELLVERCRRCA